MPDFLLYNSLTRETEPFAPADGRTVRLYTCGPTVYNAAHLGNFRTFLFEDLLRRVLRLRGWGVEQVMNLTDVDDRIIKRATEQLKTIRELTDPVIEVFHEDREFLRIQRAEHYPRATDFIAEMIELVQRLMDKGVAYKADDGSVYFAIGNSPWGRGRPGWHLECSAMAMTILGETIDLHCGGVDLIFPHHEDEIAQSEAATGKTFARVWCHGEFLLTDGSKMAKRVGNVSTVSDLRAAGVSAAALRHFVFSTHYRKQLNLSGDALEASSEAVRRIGDFADRLERESAGTPALAEAAETLLIEATSALSDDLNAPRAMGALFEFITAANREFDARGSSAEAVARAREAFRQVNAVLDVVPDRGLGDSELSSWVEDQLRERAAARQRRDFAAADDVRKALEEKGIAIEDSPSGTRWKKLR